MAEEIWRNAGRSSKPRLVACTYYALGPRAAEGVAAYIGNYYAYMGEATVQQMIKGFPTTPEAIQTTIQQFTENGADEPVLWPCVPELDQIQRLADRPPDHLRAHSSLGPQL